MKSQNKNKIIPLTLLLLAIFIITPAAMAQEEEDPVQIVYAGSPIGTSPGPLVWTGAASTGSFDVALTAHWHNPGSKTSVWGTIDEVSTYGITSKGFSLTNPSPLDQAVTLTVPVTGLSAGTYAVGIKANVAGWSPTGQPTVAGTAGYFQFKIEEPATPLTITAPGDITVEGNTEGGATGVDLGTPTVSGGTPPYVVTNDALILFPLGDTTVTWTVTDASSNSAFDTQTVTVGDTTPPTITAPDDITVEGNTEGGATGVVLGTPTVSDIVDPSPIVTNDAPSFFPLGDTVVTWTATDASGNSASATQKVTVVDTTPPTITVVSSLSVIVGAPSSVLPLPTVSDIVDPSPTVTNDAPSFFPPGTTVVTWTATDASGNSATATTTVTATYNFIGFLPPVQNPDVVNVGQAGRTYPIKWQLKDYNGNFVSDLSVVKLGWFEGTTAPEDAPEAQVSADTSGASGLRYDFTANQYIFNWQTAKGFAGKEYVFVLWLDDGTVHIANFKFKK